MEHVVFGLVWRPLGLVLGYRYHQLVGRMHCGCGLYNHTCLIRRLAPITQYSHIEYRTIPTFGITQNLLTI